MQYCSLTPTSSLQSARTRLVLMLLAGLLGIILAFPMLVVAQCPTDIALSNHNINVNQPVKTDIASLTTTTGRYETAWMPLPNSTNVLFPFPPLLIYSQTRFELASAMICKDIALKADSFPHINRTCPLEQTKES